MLMPIDKVDIKPGVSILSALRHLNYKPWYALAEFVDNAIESYLKKYEDLKALSDTPPQLIIKIQIDSSSPARISIIDNAAGISASDYERAFRPAEIPPDATGLSEFGMGMKSAACWFSPKWSVKTTALGEDIARRVSFNIQKIVNDEINELDVEEGPMKARAHFTEIVLENLHNPAVGKTVAKIREHLTDIYSFYLRSGNVKIYVNDKELVFREPEILVAPYFTNPTEQPRKWRKEISFDFGNGCKAEGFAALRSKASTTHAGFSLFRRGRVIQGSGDERYRPHTIFGLSNSFRFQRLFGEFHLEGFRVSHTKDGFQWDENEELFLNRLKEALNSEELPLLKQADGHRALEAREKLKKKASKAVAGTAEVITSHVPEVLPDIATKPPIETSVEEATHKNVIANKILDIEFENMKWKISIEAIQDPAESQWLILNDIASIQDTPRKLDIRLNLAHPFVVRFGQAEASALETQMRMGAAIAMSEVLAKDAGVRMSGTFRRNLNQILTEVMGQPS